MRDEEGAFGCAVVALVLDGVFEDILENTEISLVDGASEGDGDHLGRLLGVQFARNACAVHRAEAALGPEASARVTHSSAVGIRLGCCG